MVPLINEDKILIKLAAKQSRSKSCRLFGVGALQQTVYPHKISDIPIDKLKCVLIDCWAQLSQDMFNQAINQLPKRLMMVIKVKGAHVEFRLD